MTRDEFLAETDNSSTHPCLRDRLRAIGRLPEGVAKGDIPTAPPPAPSARAAAFYVGDHAEAVDHQLSEQWRKAVAPVWKKAHEQAQQAEKELAKLEEKADDASGDAEALWQRSLKVLQVHGSAAALPLLEELLVLEPQHPGARFVQGRILIETDDTRGVDALEQAMSADPGLTQEACELLYAYYSRTGQRSQLRLIEERMERHQLVVADAQRERANVVAADTFLWHELTPPQLAALQRVLEAEPDIGSAAVARKQVRVFPKSPCFVVGLRLSVAWWKPRSTRANAELVHRVLKQLQLPGYFMVFVAESDLKALGNKVFAAPGAAV